MDKSKLINLCLVVCLIFILSMNNSRASGLASTIEGGLLRFMPNPTSEVKGIIVREMSGIAKQESLIGDMAIFSVLNNKIGIDAIRENNIFTNDKLGFFEHDPFRSLSHFSVTSKMVDPNIEKVLLALQNIFIEVGIAPKDKTTGPILAASVLELVIDQLLAKYAVANQAHQNIFGDYKFSAEIFMPLETLYHLVHFLGLLTDGQMLSSVLPDSQIGDQVWAAVAGISSFVTKRTTDGRFSDALVKTLSVKLASVGVAILNEHRNVLENHPDDPFLQNRVVHTWSSFTATLYNLGFLNEETYSESRMIGLDINKAKRLNVILSKTINESGNPNE